MLLCDWSYSSWIHPTIFCRTKRLPTLLLLRSEDHDEQVLFCLTIIIEMILYV